MFPEHPRSEAFSSCEGDFATGIGFLNATASGRMYPPSLTNVSRGRYPARRVLVPTKNARSIAGFDDGAHQFPAVEAHNHAGQPTPTPTTVARQEATSQRGKRSEQAAILPRIQLEHEQWWKGNGQRSRVTFLVARPAVGSLWPGRCNECRSAQGSCPEPILRPREHSRSRVLNKFRNCHSVRNGTDDQTETGLPLGPGGAGRGDVALRSGRPACGHGAQLRRV